MHLVHRCASSFCSQVHGQAVGISVLAKANMLENDLLTGDGCKSDNVQKNCKLAGCTSTIGSRMNGKHAEHVLVGSEVAPAEHSPAAI